MKSKRFWRRFTIWFFGAPTLLFFVLVLIVYVKQDAIVQDLIEDLNKDFAGSMEVEDSHISMFENFPYISIDLEHFKVFETKNKRNEALVDVEDLYVGFNLWTVITGKMEIKKIKLKEGKINLVQHKNGEFNVVKALSPTHEIEDAGEEFHLDLKKVELENIDLTKLNESNNIKIEAYINDAHSKLRTAEDHVMAACDARFILNIIKDGDTTFFKHKHIDLDTQVDFLKVKDIMTIQPTAVHIEGAEFNFEGNIDFLDEVNLDLTMSGNKPNFDLFIAMAPEELIPTLRQYNNRGDIYVKTTIKGKSINGHNPAIDAHFGCKDGFFQHSESKKKLNSVNFEGYFTNGEERNISTMEFGFRNFSAKPEAGKFKGDVVVTNFRAPEVDLSVHSNVDMEFVSRFLDLKHLHDFTGQAIVDVEFQDVIDMENPEHMLQKMNEQYDMKVQLKNLSFISDLYSLPVENWNFLMEVDGHEAQIKKCALKIGKSDINISGSIDDLPAIVHHSDIPVDTRLKIKSNYLDIFGLTGSDSSAINEEIEDLSLDLDFKADARSFTESKYLPVGEFFIENMYAKLKHYPHTLHDFHADILVGERDLRVVDFKGMIDKSDFLFHGTLEHYEKWFDEHPGGDSKIEFSFVSKMLQLESLFSYKGENYVPEDYRHEEFDNLNVHGFTYLYYNDGLQSMDLTLDRFDAKMKVHPLRFENFNGRIHYEDEHLVVEDFHGKLGKSQFKTTLHYYLGDDETIKKRDNHFSITASRLDIDQLIKYNPLPPPKNRKDIPKKKVNHDDVFNIYELPFTDMTYHFDITHLNYHRYLMHNIKGELRTTPDHYIHIDKMKMDAAGGHFDIKGYFNGSNPKQIYFSPDIHATNVDLDKLLFKFDNFGQDHIVSENLHGKFTGNITGKIHMHTDLVPKIDDSEIHMDVDVVHGKLENYALLGYMSDYFKDKNLSKVLFDTLNNHIDLVDGVMIIPKMTINSSLGHMEISGQQSLSGVMEYYLRIPWKMITQTAASRLFGRKKEEASPDQIDEIQYGTKRTKYVSVKIVGDENGYKFSLGKPKKRNRS